MIDRPPGRRCEVITHDITSVHLQSAGPRQLPTGATEPPSQKTSATKRIADACHAAHNRYRSLRRCLLSRVTTRRSLNLVGDSDDW